MKIMFMGTSDFAVEALSALCENGFTPSAVISQPDKPRNRGKVTPTPVKAKALELGIDVFTPDKIKNGEISETLEKYKPDLIVVAAYGKILPEYVLNFPELGCINIHASLLPKYRGASPINFALINGEKETGVTTMYMEKGLDTGDIIFTETTPIYDTDNAGTLHDRLAKMGGRLIIKTIDALKNGTAPRTKQQEPSSYAPMIDNTLRKINFSDSAENIVNLIRGLSPYPSAFAKFEEKNIKIYEARTVTINTDAYPGTICDDKKLIVKTGNGCIEILSLQLESKKRMSGEDFLRGRRSGHFE